MSRSSSIDRPHCVQVGAVRWTVDWDEAAWARTVNRHADSEMYGCTDQFSATISINPFCAEDNARETLLHEVMHACHYGAGLTDADEAITLEQTINRLSPVWLDVLQRNASLVAYLTKT